MTLARIEAVSGCYSYSANSIFFNIIKLEIQELWVIWDSLQTTKAAIM